MAQFTWFTSTKVLALLVQKYLMETSDEVKKKYKKKIRTPDGDVVDAYIGRLPKK